MAHGGYLAAAGGQDVAVYLRPNNDLSVELPGANGGGDTFTYDPAIPARRSAGRT